MNLASTRREARIDDELRNLNQRIKLKRAMGYGMTRAEREHFEFLLAQKEEMKDERQRRSSPQRARRNLSLSTNDIVDIFRIFDIDQDDMLSSSEFFSLIGSLLELRDGVTPNHERVIDVAQAIAQRMVITSMNGNAITLSDFINNAVRGDLGKMIYEVYQVTPNVVNVLRLKMMKKTSKSKVFEDIPDKNNNEEENEEEEEEDDDDDSEDDYEDAKAEEEATIMKEKEEEISKSMTQLHQRAANAMKELEAIEHECSKLLPQTIDKKQEVRKLLALCQSTTLNFEKVISKPPLPLSNSTPVSETLPNPPKTSITPPINQVSQKSNDMDNNDNDELSPPSPLERSVSFAVGELLIFKRDNDEGYRTVQVVDLLGTGTYVVEHEIETTANHLTFPEGFTGPIQKGTKVTYKNKYEARIVQVGSADTFDEQGRPSYLVAVRTYTDADRLSRDEGSL
mmetsp:Transcript_29728/g.38327  ORF Transcript_29728/g.38327 Transcript_29728/m.38327 type:complete len:454 (-) Transcript_29728:212-1573(-)